jgi:hypothetical protein
MNGNGKAASSRRTPKPPNDDERQRQSGVKPPHSKAAERR